MTCQIPVKPCQVKLIRRPISFFEFRGFSICDYVFLDQIAYSMIRFHFIIEGGYTSFRYILFDRQKRNIYVEVRLKNIYGILFYK